MFKKILNSKFSTYLVVGVPIAVSTYYTSYFFKLYLGGRDKFFKEMNILGKNQKKITDGKSGRD